MNILLAPDSFKGCLTSVEVCRALANGIKEYSKDVNIMQFPSSDGGEGFCDCMRNIFGGELIEREVSFPLGNRGLAGFAFNSDKKTAFVELAAASGLALVPASERNVLLSSTFGTGELICEAVSLGAKRIFVGLGGSATNDCGIGMLAALGMRFYDSRGDQLEPVAASLPLVSYADKSSLLDFSGIDIVAACDVKNPLCGVNGAAEVFSRQKGASEKEVAFLDKAARNFAKVLNIDPDIGGSGAAGGVGAAVLSVLGGRYVSGASLLVDSCEFQKALSDADIVITGEGNTDAQTAFGKLVGVVVNAAREKNVRAFVVSGGLSDGYEALYSLGAEQMISLSDEKHDREYCIKNARRLLFEKAFELMKQISL